MYFLAFQETLALKAQGGNETDDAQGRLYSDCDVDRIVTGQYRCLGSLYVALTEFPFTAELLNLHRGQGLDLLWRDSLQCPSEEEYIAMVNDS